MNQCAIYECSENMTALCLSLQQKQPFTKLLPLLRRQQSCGSSACFDSTACCDALLKAGASHDEALRLMREAAALVREYSLLCLARARAAQLRQEFCVSA